MNRAAIYARYSTDLQSEKSIEDQVELCRAYAARGGLVVVATFEDRAISGASTVQRTGWRSLMAAAEAGRFDVVIAEDVDRIARDEADYHAARKRLVFGGVQIHTAHTGPISGIEGSVRAMMSAYFLENLAHKVRRGLAGVVRSGRHAGGSVYGYRQIAGKPGELVVDEAEAAIVRRILAAYAAGEAPRAIAGELNRDGVPAPRGGVWNASTIGGSRQRGTGILRNELYRGRLVWNRVRMIKDPDTGRRISRVNAPGERQAVDVPHLAIVPPELAAAVDARATGRAGTPHRARPVHLLSGLLKCGACGSGMAVHDHHKGRTRIRCSRYVESGTCDHSRRYYLEAIEGTVLAGLRDELANPSAIRLLVETYAARRRERAAAAGNDRDRLERKLGETRRTIGRLVDALAAGAAVDSVRERLLSLEAEKARLVAELAQRATTPAIALHPAALAAYLADLDRLAGAIVTADRLAGAGAAFRRLVERVTVHPVAGGEQLDLELTGSLAELMDAPALPPGSRRYAGGVGGAVVAEARIGHSPHLAGLRFRLRFGRLAA